MRWSGVLYDLKRVTKPGGWIELIEVGNRFHRAGPVTRQLVAWGTQIGATRGIDASAMSQLGDWLTGIGLGSVRSETKALPLGAWGGRVGALLAQDLLAGWPAMRPYARTLLGIATETFDAALLAVEDEWQREHTTFEVYCVCGQVTGA